jgi:hypothetical protein
VHVRKSEAHLAIVGPEQEFVRVHACVERVEFVDEQLACGISHNRGEGRSVEVLKVDPSIDDGPLDVSSQPVSRQ